jgi:hypothetical protein
MPPAWLSRLHPGRLSEAAAPPQQRVHLTACGMQEHGAVLCSVIRISANTCAAFTDPLVM